MKKWVEPKSCNLNLTSTQNEWDLLANEKPPGCVTPSGPTGGNKYNCPNANGIAYNNCTYFIPDGNDDNAYQSSGFCKYRPVGSPS